MAEREIKDFDVHRDIKILVITVTPWASRGEANTWASLLEGYDGARIANLCLRDGALDERAPRCFCISESAVIKSIFKRKRKTGKLLTSELASEKNEVSAYSAPKKKRRYFLLLMRELFWWLGKWKTDELNEFLDGFAPDVVLHSMDGYIYKNRVAEYVLDRTGARAVGYVWDDTFTYKQSGSIGYKIYRFFQRKSLKRISARLKSLFAITPATKEEADEFFGLSTEVLSKPLNREPVADGYAEVKKPIKILYTGNLSIGRDRTLAAVSSALRELDPEGEKMVLDVYTASVLSEKYLSENRHSSCRIHPPISASEVIRLQTEADVLLFVEDLSRKNATARLSFSTKITDYFSAGKCILAVGNGDLAPMRYFADTESAITVVEKENIRDALASLTDADVLRKYAGGAALCGRENHSAEKIKACFDSAVEGAYRCAE
ncbi:MAG: hypothetical protein IJ515_00960 [Clostridia bacterium]|nr:hypothetical protein [Clostridia bacterium]